MRIFLLIVAATVSLGAGCKKKSASVASAAPDPGPSANTNYVPGAGAIQNTRQAARRTVALNEMSQLGQLIELQYNDLGRMPTKQQILANLSQAPSILQHINEGNIILTGTTNHSGLWAYEVDADTRGGIVLQAGSARRATKDEVQQLLAGG